MSAEDILKRFRLIEERRAPVDERGIDGIMILEDKDWRKDRGRTRVWISAHYAKSNQWGEPLPLA